MYNFFFAALESVVSDPQICTLDTVVQYSQDLNYRGIDYLQIRASV